MNISRNTVQLDEVRSVYFLGIGGIGMSALARYFLARNILVSGYDKTRTSLCMQLEKEGAHIHYEDDVALLDKNAGLVVYTPAVPKEMKELLWYQQNQYPMASRSQVLQQITANTYNICIAGTHGKTTISTMVAHLLRDSGFGCSAFLGGIAVNYLTNYWSSDNRVVVIEADEYARSFLNLSPDVAVISAMDADHLDIYGNVESMRDAFYDFAANVKPEGLLLTRFGIHERSFTVAAHKQYSLQNSSANAYAKNIKMEKGGYVFDFVEGDEVIDFMQLHMGGMHNVENMVAAISVARYLNIDAESIRESVKSFKGVKRRFEYIISLQQAEAQKNNVVYIDDYAHHPEELRALMTGAKALFGKRKCTIIFQPHLYSRTRDMAAEFAEVLDMADEILLLPVYPAREAPIEGVSSELILRSMKNDNASVLDMDQLLDYLATNYLKTVRENPHGQILITAGAGNIDQLIIPIKQILQA